MKAARKRAVHIENDLDTEPATLAAVKQLRKCDRPWPRRNGHDK